MTDGPRGYGPRWGTMCTTGMTYGPSPAEPLGAQSKKSKQVLKGVPPTNLCDLLGVETRGECVLAGVSVGVEFPNLGTFL